jgi:xylan 1,4-beta-xylosidase
MIEHGENAISYRYPVNYKEVKQKGALPQSGNFDYTLTFDKELDPALLFMRTMDKNGYSLSKNRGLTLKLKPETVMELGNPAFIGKRQQHLLSTAETELDFTPKSEKEKAGLIILQDEDHFYWLCKSQSQQKDVLQLYKSVPRSKSMELLTEVPLTGKTGKVGLRISSLGDTYSFHFSTDAKNWNLLKDKVDGKFLSSKVAGSFIGCLYGMYATSSGEASTNSASFQFLKYRGDDSIYR